MHTYLIGSEIIALFMLYSREQQLRLISLNMGRLHHLFILIMKRMTLVLYVWYSRRTCILEKCKIYLGSTTTHSGNFQGKLLFTCYAGNSYFYLSLRVPKQVILPDTELSEERAVPPVTYRSDIKNVLDNAAEYNSLLHRMIFESKGISSLERCFRADIASRTTAQVQKASNSLRYHHIVELFMFSAILPSYSNIHSNK